MSAASPGSAAGSRLAIATLAARRRTDAGVSAARPRSAAGSRLAVAALALGSLACGGASAVAPRTRIAVPPSEPLMLGIATVSDGRQGFSNAFFFNVEPDRERCAPVDVAASRGAVCTIRDCRPDAGVAELPTRLVDLGDVLVTSPSHPPTTLRHGADGLYALDGETGLRWLAGDAVTIAISGGVDGAAASADLVVPIEPRLLEPALPADGAELSISRRAPLEVRWEPFDGVAHAFLGQFADDPAFWLRHVEMECLVDGADGELSIPVELLSRFAPSDETLLSNFALGARVWTDVRSGDRTLRVVAQTGRSIWVRFF